MKLTSGLSNSNAKNNQNLNEVCQNLKQIYFCYMTDKSSNYTLPISITWLYLSNSDNVIKINNLNEFMWKGDLLNLEYWNNG